MPPKGTREINAAETKQKNMEGGRVTVAIKSLWSKVFLNNLNPTSHIHYRISLSSWNKTAITKLSSDLAMTTQSQHKACHLGQKTTKRRILENSRIIFPYKEGTSPKIYTHSGREQPSPTPQTPTYAHSESRNIPRGLNTIHSTMIGRQPFILTLPTELQA